MSTYAHPQRRLVAWAEARPALPAVAAIQLASSAADVSGILECLRTHDEFRSLGASLKMQRDWERYWRSPVTWTASLVEAAAKIVGISNEERAWWTGVGIALAKLLEKGKPPKNVRLTIKRDIADMTPRRFRSAVAYGRRYLKVLLPSIVEICVDDNAAVIAIKQQKAIPQVLTKHSALAYFLRVVFPCVAEYGQTPWTLFRTATERRKPDRDALLKLVRIDKQVIHHPQVRAIVHDPTRSRSWLPHIAKALISQPRKRNPQQWKYRTARLIRRQFESLGYRITEPEIRELFDLVASGRDEGVIDRDMAETPEALTRALSRDKDFWQVVPRPDTKTLEAVRALRGHAA